MTPFAEIRRVFAHSPMKLPSILLALLALLTLASFTREKADDYGTTCAKNLLARGDADKNGLLEKAELGKQWRRLASLDLNKDQALSLDELSKVKQASLSTKGEQQLNLVYKTIGKKELHLDLYYPGKKTDAKLPLIIYTHGGGWAAGSKNGIASPTFQALYLALLDKGFAVASVNYRLCNKGGTVAIRDCVTDCKDALRYLAKNGDNLGLDPQKIFVHGDSAGGQIAQMLLLTSPESLPGDPKLVETSYKIIAGVSWYGPCDFEKTDLYNYDDRPDFKDRFGPRRLTSTTPPGEKLTRYREMSPIQYLKKDSPPLLMIQGDKDTTIPVKHAYYMQEKAKALGAPVEIMIIENSGHNWRPVDAPIDPTREVIVQRTIDFLTKHLQSAFDPK